MTDLVISGAVVSMSSLEISALVESRHDNVKRSIERIASAGVIELPPTEEVKNLLGQTVSVYFLDKRSSLIVVAQLSPEFTGRIVDRWQELEKQALGLPDFTNPATAAIAWAEQYTRATEAERTKALIGSKREATAMATASNATRKAKKLEIELDKSKQYATVKRVEIMFPGKKFPWQPLKSYSKDHGFEMPKVFDQNYGDVNSYHADVWFNVYGVEIC